MTSLTRSDTAGWSARGRWRRRRRGSRRSGGRPCPPGVRPTRAGCTAAGRFLALASVGYRRASLPATPQARGPRRASPVPRTTVWPFNTHYAGGFLSARFRIPGTFHGLRRRNSGSAPSPPAQGGFELTTLAQVSLHAADRPVASAPLRTRPLDHARGHRYQGPGCLPDRTRTGKAALGLSFGYVMTASSSSRRPNSGRTVRKSRSKGSLRFELRRMNELLVSTQSEGRVLDATDQRYPYTELGWPRGHGLGWGDSFVLQLRHFL